LESRFFGEGVGIALRKDDVRLRRALDWALARLAARGVYGELYLKNFPIGFD
jgi:polar amino acid transport system substrate-binding protein